MDKAIKIYMEGGCLLDVEGLPPNYTYQLIDYDDIEQDLIKSEVPTTPTNED